MIRWIWAFLDRPLPQFERAAEFWCAVTDTDLSPRRGAGGEFATFLPRHADADACLKLQGVYEGGGAHIDLDVDDVGQMTRAAVEEHGASLVRRDGEDLSVLRTPGGQLFCLSTWAGHARHSPVVEHADGSSSRVDQVTFDISPEHFDRDAAFWSGLTGWELGQSRASEFVRLEVPGELPIRILLQRCDTPGPAGAHVDVACSDVDRVRALHESLGARKVADGKAWQVMCDPVGGVYCLTPRDPRTGLLPG